LLNTYFSVNIHQNPLNKINMTIPKENAYKRAGVNYESLDPFKKLCLDYAAKTNLFAKYPFKTINETRGESAFGFHVDCDMNHFDVNVNSIFHVEEGLGTKNLIADAMQKITGEKHYHASIAQDAVAMIVNDLITQGVTPLSIAMHLAVGDSAWFDDHERCGHLARGWYEACNKAEIVWSGGETPALKGIIYPDTYLLNGSAIGFSDGYRERSSANSILAGDSIVVFESSGVHANGLTLCRKIADGLPEGYLTRLSDDRTYGQALLEPTVIYSTLMESIYNHKTEVHYAVNITGHGWKKFMRPDRNFEYVINDLPSQNTLFDFLINNSGFSSTKEAYETFNMGAGFALYVPKKSVELILKIAKIHGVKAFEAGVIKDSDSPKVTIVPLNIEYNSLFY
jgi:phosphoribosylformylglycinamidine cyclo-ligase